MGVEALGDLVDPALVAYYPSWETLPHERLSPRSDTVAALPSEVSIVLIEHDMDLVFNFADRITVLVNGAVLTEGTPQEIAHDPQVKAVYLGSGHD